MVNINLLVVARYFHYKVELFFKEIVLDGSFWNTKYYSFCINFQERCGPRVHSFIWIFNTQNIHNETAYIEFIANILNLQFPEILIRFTLIQEHGRNITKNECRFSYSCFFTDKTIIEKPLETGKNIDKENESLM